MEKSDIYCTSWWLYNVNRFAWCLEIICRNNIKRFVFKISDSLWHYNRTMWKGCHFSSAIVVMSLQGFGHCVYDLKHFVQKVRTWKRKEMNKRNDTDKNKNGTGARSETPDSRTRTVNLSSFVMVFPLGKGYTNIKDPLPRSPLPAPPSLFFFRLFFLCLELFHDLRMWHNYQKRWTVESR